MHLRSNVAGLWVLGLTGLMGLGGVAGLGQAPIQRPGQASPLTVDRDPSPSPDADPVPGAATTTGPQTGVGQIAKGENGRYTLKQDAYEVVLNASVIDGSGQTIQTLDQDAFPCV